MKSNKGRSWKKWAIGFTITAVVVGFSAPIAINLASKSKEVPEEAEVFVPYWNNGFDQTKPLYNLDKEGTEFTETIELAYGYQAEVLPTSVELPKPENGTDSLTIDGTSYHAEESVKWWTPSLPADVAFYKHKDDYSDTNLAFTTDPTMGLGYVAEVLPTGTQIGNPVTVDDKVVIDGVEYGAQIDFTRWKNGEIPDGAIYNNSDTTLDNHFTVIENQALGYIHSIPEQLPNITINNQVTEMFNLKGGDQYDSSKWEWNTVTEPVAGVDEIEGINPTIDFKTIENANPGDLYDPSLWTWEKTHEGTPGEGLVTETKSKIRTKPDEEFVELTTVSSSQEYDPSLWTYSHESDWQWWDNNFPHEDSNGIKKSFTVQYRKITANYDGIPISEHTIAWISKEAFLQQNHPERLWQSQYFELLDAGSAPFGADSIQDWNQLMGQQNQSMFPQYGIDDIYVQGTEFTPPTASTDPQIWEASYNGTSLYTQEFGYSGETVHNPPVDGEVPDDFTDEAVQYDAGRLPSPKDDGTSGVYKPEYNGIEIAQLNHLTIPNNGSIVGDAPSKLEPEDFDETTMWNEGVVPRAEFIPDPVSISIHDYAEGDTIHIATLNGTIHPEVEVGIGWESFPVHPKYYSLGTEYVSDITKADGYAAEVLPTPYDIYSEVEEINTSITIDGNAYATQAERYVFNIENNIFYSVVEGSKEFTTTQKDAFDYVSESLPTTITGSGSNWSDAKLLELALSRDDRTIRIVKANGEASLHTWLES